MTIKQAIDKGTVLLKGKNIVSKLDLVYPIKNGIEAAKKTTNEWIKNNLK